MYIYNKSIRLCVCIEHNHHELLQRSTNEILLWKSSICFVCVIVVGDCRIRWRSSHGHFILTLHFQQQLALCLALLSSSNWSRRLVRWICSCWLGERRLYRRTTSTRRNRSFGCQFRWLFLRSLELQIRVSVKLLFTISIRVRFYLRSNCSLWWCQFQQITSLRDPPAAWPGPKNLANLVLLVAQ